MGRVIQMSGDDMGKVADIMQQNADAVNNAINDLNAKYQQIHSDYVGQAANQFFTDMEDLFKKLNELYQFFEDSAQHSRSISSKIHEGESLIRGLRGRS